MFSPDTLGSILADVGHVYARTLILVTIRWGLHSDGVGFLLFHPSPLLTLICFLLFICECLNYFYMFPEF